MRKRIRGSGSPRVTTKRIVVDTVTAKGTTGALRRAPINAVFTKSRLTTPPHKGIRMPGIQARDTLGPNY